MLKTGVPEGAIRVKEWIWKGEDSNVNLRQISKNGVNLVPNILVHVQVSIPVMYHHPRLLRLCEVLQVMLTGGAVACLLIRNEEKLNLKRYLIKVKIKLKSNKDDKGKN